MKAMIMGICFFVPENTAFFDDRTPRGRRRGQTEGLPVLYYDYYYCYYYYYY